MRRRGGGPRSRSGSSPPPGDLDDLTARLRDAYGLERVIVAPGEGTPEQTARDVGAALGQDLSDLEGDGMVVGVGWGRTLDASLATFRPQARRGAQVVSLLGGLLEARTLNPIDFSWQMAGRLGADCLLFMAPSSSARPRRSGA